MYADIKFLLLKSAMKKLFSISIILILIFSSFVCTYAAEAVSFEITDCECDKNRLFTVDIVAKSDSKFSAGTFEFTYDKSMFEFRSAKVTDDNSRIMTNELSNSVKAVYLNANGKDIKNGEVIFTVTFKSVKSGEGYIDFTVSDCVNSNAEFIDIGKCTSAKITVSGSSSDKSSSDSSNSSNNSSSKNSKDSSNDGKSSSTRDKNQETTSDSTIDEMGLLNPIDDKSTRFLIIGIAIGVSAIVLFMLGYFITRKIFSRHKENDERGCLTNWVRQP